MIYSLQEEHVDLLNLFLAMSKQNLLKIEYEIFKSNEMSKRIIETDLFAYGDSQIRAKIKVKIIEDKKEDVIEEYTCGLKKDNFSAGRVGFSEDDLEKAETVLQIMYFMTTKLKQMKAVEDINKKGVLE